MGRNVVEKILYRRRRFVTKARIRTAADIISQLLPVVAAGRPSAMRVSAALDAITRHISNDLPPQAVAESSNGLRQRIKGLKSQLHSAPNSTETEQLRAKLDVLYDLLLEEAENPE